MTPRSGRFPDLNRRLPEGSRDIKIGLGEGNLEPYFQTKGMKQPVVLDSFALISFFHQEPGWEAVRTVFKELTEANEKAALSRISWGEFYYIVQRRVGRTKTQEALALIEQLPINLLSVDDQLISEAAEIKSEYPIAYADAFCVATAKRLNARILTSDPEFKAVEKLVSVQWITGRRRYSKYP